MSNLMQSSLGRSLLVDSLRMGIDAQVAMMEMATGFMPFFPFLKNAPAAKKRRGVILIPGFMADDLSLKPLGWHLKGLGYDAEGWGQGRNMLPRDKSIGTHMELLADKLGDKIRRLADKHSEPVSIVGQSLGGIVARELAVALEDDIDRVLMLGSPTFHPYISNQHNKALSLMGEYITMQSYSSMLGHDGLLHWFHDKPKMPCVAIYSPIDGLVHSNAAAIPYYIRCQSEEDAPRENLPVLASHTGMGFSPWVRLAVADRLGQDRQSWQYFDASRYLNGATENLADRFYPGLEDAQKI